MQGLNVSVSLSLYNVLGEILQPIFREIVNLIKHFTMQQRTREEI